MKSWTGLGSAKDRYADTTIQRCSQIIETLGDSVDKVFDTDSVENEIYRHRRHAQKDVIVSRLVEILYEDDLFATIIGRRHSAFPDFELNETPKQADKFPAVVKAARQEGDSYRCLV